LPRGPWFPVLYFDIICLPLRLCDLVGNNTLPCGMIAPHGSRRTAGNGLFRRVVSRGPRKGAGDEREPETGDRDRNRDRPLASEQLGNLDGQDRHGDSAQDQADPRRRPIVHAEG